MAPGIAKSLTKHQHLRQEADSRITFLSGMRGNWEGPVYLPTPFEGAVRSLSARSSRFRAVTDLSNSAESCERAAHHFGRPHTTGVVCGLGFKQFSLCQKDSQLVIQAVKQRLKIETWLRIGVESRLGPCHACDPDAARESVSSGRAGAAASRHSVSAKILMDPPAVRTYSTLPAEIQL
jgi:hypothetical protein